jgi:serine/threonine-protein kinase
VNEPTAAPDAARPAGPDLLPPAGGRYEFLGEIARGGMGVIYRATDTVLRREVAVKVLQDKFGPASAAARRFADEARIAAQLQHPAIPAVHDLGALADGRLFLAMKLIKGQTLEDLLQNRPDPSAERGRFVAVFEQVCQALAYAHAHDVIHRDLKPANVMVGSFGEVQVMDWGLAKVLAGGGRERPEDPNETTGGTEIRSMRESDGSFTQAGAVLGTPAFMPPEQALGAIGKIDARSDVFGLGAVLAVVLTGQPPFAASSAETTRIRAAQGKVDECFERLDACGADPGLVALCKKCLSPDPAGRPADAGEVAGAVAELRHAADERARQAELDRVRAEGERAKAELRAAEQRKRRRVQLALAAAVLVAVLGGGGGLLWYQQDRAARRTEAAGREAEIDRDASLALQQADRDRASGLYAEATASVRKAEGRLAGGGPEHLHRRVAEMRKDLEMLAQLADVRRRMADLMKDSHYDPLSTTPRFAAAFGDYGIDLDQLDVSEAARRIAASAIRGELVEAIEDWADDLASQYPHPAATELARLQATPSDPRDRTPMHEHALMRRKRLQVVTAADPEPGPLVSRLRRAVAELDRDALRRVAADPAAESLPPRAHLRLAINLYLSGGSSEEVVEVLRRVQRRHPSDFWINSELGYQLMRTSPRRPDEALRFHSVAVGLRPQSPGAHHNLGHALQALGRFEEAIAAYRKAIELQPAYAYAHNNLGNSLIASGRAEQGITHLRKATELQPGYAEAHSNLGMALLDLGRAEEALASCREAVKLNPGLAEAHHNLGIALIDVGRRDEAFASFRRAVQLQPGLVSSRAVRRLMQQGKADDALALGRLVAELAPQDADAHNTLAVLLLARDDYAGALAAADQAVQIDPKVPQAHTNRGLALAGLGQLAEAIAACRKAVEVDPTFARGHYRLGAVLLQAGRLSAATAALQQAVTLNPADGEARTRLGMAMMLQGRLPEALVAFEKAADLAPGAAERYHATGNRLIREDRAAEAEAALRKAVALGPTLADAHIDLGLVLMWQRRLPEAVAALRKGVELKPAFGDAHYNLGLALRESGALGEAEGSLRRAVELQPRDPDSHFDLGVTLQRQGRFSEAIPAMRRGLELLPPADPRRIGFARAVAACEQQAVLDEKLTAVLAGKARPTDEERLALGELALLKRRYAAAAGFFREAFAARPAWADDPGTHARYNAACAAALAGSGQGEDAGSLAAGQRAGWQKQALAWLRADLALWRKRAASSSASERKAAAAELGSWLGDSDLATTRPGVARIGMPADERVEWDGLWADVRVALAEARKPAPQPETAPPPREVN